MSYSYNIVNSIAGYYERNHYYYEFDDVCATFTITVKIEDDIEINQVRHEIKITESGYLIHSVPDLYVETSSRHNMLRYINIVNGNLAKATNHTFSFGFDLINGELSFNKSTECGNIFLSDEDIDSMTSFSECTIYIFCEGLYNVTYGYDSPESAASKSMQKLEEAVANSRNQNSCASNDSCESEKVLYTKVAGTTFDGRQGIISDLKNNGMLHHGQSLLLQREHNNKYDSNAVQVIHSQSKQILGYIPKDKASDIARKMDNGTNFIAYVEAVTGGNSYNLGINIKVCVEDDMREEDDDYDYDDGRYDGWGDLNPYDLDAGDYEAWMDSFD